MSSRSKDVQVAEFSYKIYIGGKLLDNTRMKNIQEIVYEENCTGSDLLQIYINDPDMKFLSDNILVEKTSIRFEAIYISSLGVKSNLTFKGYVSIIDVDFADDGVPQLVLQCMDNTYKMDRKLKKRTWEKTKRSTVASKIFKEYGFKTKIDSTSKKVDSISQSNETDIAFLTKLAEEEDYLVYVEGDTGYFVKKPTSYKSQATLKYKEAPYDIISFSPRITKNNNDN